MSYDQPDKGAGFAPSDHPEWANQLFLIWPISVENVIFTRSDGQPDPTDIVTADVAIVSLMDPKTGAPVFLKNARIGGKALTPQIKNKIGKKVLGKFVQLAKQPGKNAAFALDVPESSSPEWAAMVAAAEQYEAQHPRVNDSYESSGGGAPAWGGGTQTSGTQPQQATAPPWGSVAPSTNGGTPNGTPTAAPAAQTWGAPPPTPAPAAAPPWPPGLAEFLTSRGYDTGKMDEQQARQIAATLQ